MSSTTIADKSSSSRSPMVADELFFSFSRELTDDERFFSFSRELTDAERSSIPRELKTSTSARVNKATHVSAFLNKVSNASLEVLDVVGSSVTSLHFSHKYRGFLSYYVPTMRNKVSILAFEVANTFVKGFNLWQSLLDENIQILKKEVLHSKGVKLLVSTDMTELLRTAAADKREEFEIFSKEVVRFGDMCLDHRWHNLDRFFARMVMDIVTNGLLREEAEMTMQEFPKLIQHTAELYIESYDMDRLEQVYRSNLEKVESQHLPRKGESLMISLRELKHQRKIVRNLKKKSLWSKNLEEVVETLVDVVTLIHQRIVEIFGENDAILPKTSSESTNKTERLGAAGLSLHYANLISQIDNIASHPMSLHPDMRDMLYNSLPASVKACLRSHLQALESKEVMTMPEIKAELDKTLQWLVPIATNTTKAHKSFGWVGEWANSGFELGKKTEGSNNIIWLQTLYHADKHKTDQIILDLIILLHRLISLANDQLPTTKGKRRSRICDGEGEETR